MKKFQFSTNLTLAFLVSVTLSTALARSNNPEQKARQILEATGIKGGLVVQIGCGDAKLTAALHANNSYLVHGLDTDAQNVTKAREYIQSRGIYGNVSIARFDGKQLLYIDNLVNLVVSEDLGDVPMQEVLRVLCPNGVAYIKEDGIWKKTVKARPREIDEWTHYLHSSTNNAVSNDTVVKPSNYLQWTGGPCWTRHHDFMSSFTAMVSAGGRLFYTIDEGPRSQIQLPAQWSLIARDAFNGMVLWKRPMDNWQTHLWSLKSGPATLPRRLIAIGDTVYVTLGLDKPVTALDAASGRILRTYGATKAAEEIIYRDGVLYVLINEKADRRPWSTRLNYTSIAQIANESEIWAWDCPPRKLAAFEASSGRELWKINTTVVPMTLTSDNDRVYYHDGDRLVAIDRQTGEQLWTSEPLQRAAKIRSWFAPTLVVHKNVVLFAGGEKIQRHRGGRDTMTALDAKTGDLLWTAPHPPSGYDSPEDLFVIDDLVWTAPLTNKGDSGRFTGRDLYSGQVKRTFPADDGIHMPHHRCYRAKATVNYILTSRTGIEYVDLRKQKWDRNDWVRGACLYGIMPANGMVYAPQHSCACYITAKLNGLNALVSTGPNMGEGRQNTARLVKGPAYAESPTSGSHPPSSDSWPTYRHDPARSGKTDISVPTDVQVAWQARLKGKLSAPVVAYGKVFVAEIDRHTVQAINAATGEALWCYTAGARIDSAPTVWLGRVLFGSADGCVYCVRADDGMLIWRFRAAPADQRLMSFEQLESVWPVHGSVLVHNGQVHAVAGRSMYLDGGLHYVRLDAITGKLIGENVMNNLNPETGKPMDADIHWPDLPVALPDILSCDGQSIYMRSQRFDLTGKRPTVEIPDDEKLKHQSGPGAHLFCPTGFLDDSWWHRTYWIWGKTPGSSAGRWFAPQYAAPTGRILVADNTHIYGFGRKPENFSQTTTMEYQLFRVKKTPELIATGKPRKQWLPAPAKPAYDWTVDVPLLGRAILLAGDKLFVAGPPDMVDTTSTALNYTNPKTQAALINQRNAMLGKYGALLVAVSLIDGSTLNQSKLDSVPVFDGMAAAYGRLYISTQDGSIVCMAGK